MTSSLDLLDLVHAAIVGPGVLAAPLVFATAAQGRVYKPGDWPTQPGQYPIIKLRLIGEDRQSLGRSGAPQFTTTATIRIIGEVSAPAMLDDGGATVAETAMWMLKRQIEVAVVNSYPLTTLIQQFASIRSQLAFNSEGATHLAGVQIDLSLEFYEGPENFSVLPSDPLAEVDLSAAHYDPFGFRRVLQP